ncbi:Nucleotide-binding oligomerization domain-containing protein 2 [Hondaea fermentalgiana]|uniref:Nucleotide-binding oligomerization domain-containing protein 2 n=1 Tax=Hondaea fermentalgiana TaxID=2315210 RepID=A0A2R5GDU0_9STRA|nr:Nucleotide-binding oligomerization domain-containing protein 2 [Hondaea fermentalgiana]|eukprot:GBG26371.1 Nucleotide-binding oligomerization domain-containing protein 2 [Hondaea fermentalgiana]
MEPTAAKAPLPPRQSKTKSKTGADFSYSEKDLLPLVSNELQTRMRKLSLVETTREMAHVTQVKAYGEAFVSKARAPKHNGQEVQKLAFSLRFEICWFGRVFLGTSTLGSASGKVKIGEVDFENVDKPETWQVETKLDVESVPGVPASAAAATIPELSDVEVLLRKLVKEQGQAKLVELIGTEVTRMLIKREILASQERKVSEDTSEEARQDTSGDGADDPASMSENSCDDLRRQMLGKDYLRIIDGEDASAFKETSWALRICTIHDRDVPALCAKLAENTGLQTLDLYFNYIGDEGLDALASALIGHKELKRIDLRRNRIGDLGLQSLMARLGAGHLPSLTEIDLRENEAITNLGRTMISALKLMRPNTKVTL